MREIVVKEAEKRAAARHRGKLPVTLEGAKGITRDFSVAGIYFATDRAFSPGQPIEFSILLEYADPKALSHLSAWEKL